MRNLLLLNMVLGVGLAYAAMREYRRDARSFRLLSAVSGLSLAISLAMAWLP
jgi:hypothetical protein